MLSYEGGGMQAANSLHPLIYSQIEHVLFVYFLKPIQKINFADFINHKPSLGSREVPQKLGLINSAVLTIIEYKQTRKVYS